MTKEEFLLQESLGTIKIYIGPNRDRDGIRYSTVYLWIKNSNTLKTIYKVDITEEFRKLSNLNNLYSVARNLLLKALENGENFHEN